jgi:hypothetical protein
MRTPMWNSVDDAIQAAVVNVRALDARRRRAVDEAREASEHVAAVERDDEARRAGVMASGEADPGRDAKAINAAEKRAEKAAENSRLLAAAFLEATRRLEAVCRERAEEWQALAREQQADAAAEFVETIGTLERAYRRLIEARAQTVLATSERERRRGQARVVDLSVDLGVPDPPSVTAVLAALAQLVAPAEEAVAVE